MSVNQNSGYGQAQIGGIPFTTGLVFLVADENNSNINNIQNLFLPDGNGIARRYSTVDAAINACTADNNDIILVAPGHAETIASATSLVPDVAGVQIIGLGKGSNRPTFTYSATGSSIDISGAGTVLKNVILLSSITAVVVGVNVDAADVTLEDVEFNFDATGDDFITMLDCDAVNGMTLRNCAFLAENIAGCDEALRLDTTSDTVIEGCRFFGDFTDSCIIGEGALGTNLIIRNNDFYNADTTAGKIIDLNVAYTGKISYNSMGTLFATNVTAPFDPGSCLCNQNFMCNAVDEHGVIVPTTASA